MIYVIFDDRFHENFYPLTLTRSTGDLRVGILKLRQRISAYLEAENLPLIISARLTELYRERHPEWQINKLPAGEITFINSRLRINDSRLEQIRNLPANSSLLEDDTVMAARCKTEEQEISSENIETLFTGLSRQTFPSAVDDEKAGSISWKFIWELIASNSEYIGKDFEDFFYDKNNYYETEPGVTILNPYNVWLGEGTELKPGVVMDASEGPIVVDENAKILPNSTITGPAYIGKSTLLKAGSKIYAGTSIGPLCKIGGEIEDTIFQGYSNKQHDGFLGHSYLGEWVNLGAGTNNSDLKNNYQQIKVYLYPQQKKIDTGSQFMGTVIGDHTKTGINCAINTGTVIGIGCNLYGQELFSDFIPSFSWGNSENLVQYRIDRFLQTVSTVKERRGLHLTGIERELYSSLNEQLKQK